MSIAEYKEPKGLPVHGCVSERHNSKHQHSEIGVLVNGVFSETSVQTGYLN